ncbi:pentatricopeptide repeat-containing protein [Tripterygium wilfordii]|uniref:Pentatricopeptide repeat-containing protein n=1 Tax=Tripterygium wilfordii TaxID=458696 RepID=A0A7J7CPY6_TRIWF|nr:pentatricopeptide repeat-containing protein At5g27110-like [Tripterygium wilfordii]KAF5736140.1 pentatricopeptide repeat-containing protein [Tripterygium wilfordii]
MFFNSPWRFLSHFSLRHLSPSLFRFSNYFSSRSEVPLIKDITNPSIHLSAGNSASLGFSRSLKMCNNVRDLNPLKCLLIVLGLIKNELLLGEFISSSFRLGAPDIALSVFRTIDKPSLFLGNLIFRGLSNRGLYDELLNVYIGCRFAGCPSDDFTFPFVIKACSALGAFGVGKAIHGFALRTGFDRNVVIQTALIDLYGKRGHTATARAIVDEIPQPDLVSWNALIAGYSLNGLDQEALEVLRHIFEAGLKPNLSTLASIIPVCTRLGCVSIGKSLHGYAVRLGYFLNEFLAPALISMYAGYVELSTSRKLFDSLLEKKNVNVWNAMIWAYVYGCWPFKAFEMFQQMLQAGVQPNPITFVSILPSCELHNSIFYGESLHAFVVKHGVENQLSVQTALVSVYSKLGDVSAAEFLFDGMHCRILLSWNAMLSGYSQNGQWHSCWAIFCEMLFAGCNPDAISIVSVLSACSKMEAVLPGESVHAFSVRRGIDLDLNVSNALLAFYSACHEISSCFMLFQQMTSKDVVSWNTLISGCIHSGEPERVLPLLHQMQNDVMKMDLVTLITILPTCGGSDNLKQGMVMHCYAIKTGYASDVSLANALISMYCKCGDLDSGRSLFEVMPERSVVSWNALITGFRYNNQPNKTMLFFSQMIKEDEKPDSVTLLNILPVCHTQSQGKSMHAFAVRAGILRDTPLFTSLMVMYARFQNMKSCIVLFEVGKKEGVSLWNAFISLLVQMENAEKAVATFRDLLQMGLKRDSITYLSLIAACVQLNDLNLADSVLAHVIREGFEKDLAVSNAFVNLYARCGSILKAERMFECLLSKDAVSWSVMINSYGLHGDCEAALELFSQMQISGVRPNGITFLSLLSACSHAGLVDQGRVVFNSMEKHGISPSLEHYACIVDLLGRTGHLNEAYETVKRLPCNPSVSLLESLLGACRNYGNIELGEKVAYMLFDMDSENPVPYVMLHNIYAAAGRWIDADNIRSYLEGRQLKKPPGFSLVSRNGQDI